MVENKKALVVGGASGIGAAVVLELLNSGYQKVYIADRNAPDIVNDKIVHIALNLVVDDVEILREYTDIDTLIITAGVGRLDYFYTNTANEIDNCFTINTISVLKIIKVFYHKIHSHEPFLCAVVSSVAGRVSSPLYATYSATKAAVSRFIESVNAELGGEGFINRILDVCPGHIKGTRFHGGQNDFPSLEALASEIVYNMQNKNTLFIPNSEVYENVITRYQTDPDTFGIESYNYKLKKNDLETKSKMTVGYLSGSFDLFHIGHLNLLRRAKRYCDYLIVGVHADGSHKGKELIIPLHDRMEIVAGCKYVDKVIECKPSDLDAYEEIKYDFLFVGSDYQGTERFRQYEEVLTPLGVQIIYFPYTKEVSSTQLRGVLDKRC